VVFLIAGLIPFLCHAQLDKSNKTPIQEQKIENTSGKILFFSNREDRMWRIWMLQNGQMKKIADRVLEAPRWSPGGRKILCMDPGSLKENYKIWVIDLMTEKVKILDLPRLTIDVVWGESDEIIYYAGWQGEGKEEIYTIYRYGIQSNIEDRIFEMKQGYFISELGYVSQMNSFLFRAVMPMVEGGIYLYQKGMTEPKLLIRGGYDPRWSPDGKKFVYSKHLSPKELNEIFLYDMTTGESKRLTNNNWEDRDPCFSPDGTQICFSSFRHRQSVSGSELYVMNIDGSNERRITPVEDNPKYPNTFQRWSTDQYPDWAP